MAQPPTGPVGSGQAAVQPDSGDEGDHGSLTSCAAVLATALENIDGGPMPPFGYVDQSASRLPDLAPIVISRASTTTHKDRT
jgi:hypothetical protein